jgi:CubicO group peptidase (beta-lactamase class C family)
LNHITIDERQGIDQFPAMLAAGHTAVKPGSFFFYGGTALATGARAIEVVTGKPWLTVFAKRIAAPCGMRHTVTGHNLWTFSGIVGGDNFPCSNAADYINFLRMILNDGIFDGRRVLSQAAVREMQADQLRGAVVEQPAYPEKALGERHHAVYGLGEWRLVLDAKGEAVVLSSPSFAGFFPWIDKRHGIAGVFVARASGAAKIDTFISPPVISKLVGQALDTGR